MSTFEKHSDEKGSPGYVTELDDGASSVDTLTALIVEGEHLLDLIQQLADAPA